MRLAIAGFNLESVTFLPNPTTLNDFEVLAKRGQDLLDSFSGTNTVPGGFIEECNAHKIEILPLVYSEAGAAASATDEAFDHYLSEISEGILEEKIALDGILLGLHGALVTNSGKTDFDFIHLSHFPWSSLLNCRIQAIADLRNARLTFGPVAI